MKIPNLSGITKLYGAGKLLVAAHRPEILLGASVATTVSAVVMAAKGGYEARGLVDAAQSERDLAIEGGYVPSTGQSTLTLKEKANLTWHCYLPAATLTVGSLGSTAGLHIVHVREKKALAVGALAAIEQVKAEAKQFELDNAGKLSPDEKQAVLEGRADENGNVALDYGDGEIEELYLVRDAKTGRDRFSNEHRIRDAVIRVNDSLSRGENVELAEFYSHAGFDETADSYDVGWNAGDYVDLKWTMTVRDDGRPVREFSFRPVPNTGYNKFRD